MILKINILYSPERDIVMFDTSSHNLQISKTILQFIYATK